MIELDRAGFVLVLSRIDHQLFQRHHRRLALVLITALARKMHAAFAWRAFLGARAAEVNLIVEARRARPLASSRIGNTAGPDPTQVDRQIRKGRICRPINGERSRRGPQGAAERKRGGYDSSKHN